nr:leucine-rich repeat domain-containing protein [Lachnospiraceae bacterium]
MKRIITKLTAIALVFALMISGIIVGTEKTVYADTQSGFTLSMGTSGETADFKAFCTENGFSMLQNGKMAVSLYDVNIGDELYYYSKNSGLNQKFRVTDVTENTVELLFVDHVNEMETVRIANDSRNGYAQSAFINRYATWAMTGAGKKYFYGALTDEQKGALVKKSLGYDYISNGEKIFNLSGGSKQMSITETVTGIFGPVSIKNAQQNYATYDNAKKIWSVGQPYFTVTLSGYESHAYNNYDIDKGEFAWIVNSDGSLATRQWSGNSLRNGCTYSNAFTGYIVPCFSVDKEKWEQCTREYLKETTLLKAQSMTFSGIAASSELRLYNNSATERNITLLESRDGMISPYDGADLGEIPVNRTITIPFYNASGVKYNANSSRQIFISAVLIADNKVKYYGRLAEMDAREGEVDLTIPSDLTIGKKHHILLFEENASNLDNNTMSKPQIMSFTPISEVNDTVDLQELNGVAEGVTFKGIYSIGYDSTAGKEVRFVDNLYVTDGAEHLAEGGVLKIPGSITIDGEEYIVNTIGSGTYDKPFVPRDTEFVSLSLPRNIKEIKPYAFFGSKIEELTIDASLLEIGTGAFSRCKNLKVAGIKISSGTIGNRAFYDNNSIETVNLEGGITVGEESFAGCEALTCIIVKALVGAVKKGAFRGSAITELYLPNTVDAHEFSFENSDKLKVIEIDMTTLKNNVFENCPAITRIVFDENVETVEE